MAEIPTTQRTVLLDQIGVISPANTQFAYAGVTDALENATATVTRATERAKAEIQARDVAQAKVEGTNAVGRDAQGRPTIAPLDFSDPVKRAKTHAAILGYLSEHQIDARAAAAEQAIRFKNDPAGFQAWAKGATEGVLAQLPDPRLRGEVAHIYDSIYGQTYTKLLTDKDAADEAMAKDAFNKTAGLLKSDVLALADQGMIGTKAYADAVNGYVAHLDRGVGAAFLNEEARALLTKEIADEGEARGLAALAVRDGQAAFAQSGKVSDAKAATEARLKDLNDPSLKIPEERRRLAVEIARQEINRFGAIQEAKVAEANNARAQSEYFLAKAQRATAKGFLARIEDPNHPQGPPTVKEILESNLEAFGQNSQETFLGIVKSGGNANVTNPAVYRELRGKILNGEIAKPADVLPYIGKGLSISDYQRLESETDAMASAQGRADAAIKKKFLDMAEPQISASNLFGGKDPVGEENFYKFQFAVDDALAKGVAAGKAQRDMLDPNSKDYIGGLIDNFRRTQAQTLQDQVRAIQGGPRIEAPLTQPRKPGETIEQYRKRTGQ